MASDFIEPAVTALLAKRQRGMDGFRLEPLSAGGNNRVFILHCGNERQILKWYFQDATDTRDRLGAEFAFLEHAWKMGLRCVPEPIDKDLISKVALYEFVEGDKLEASQVDEAAMQQAAQFLASLNSPQSRALATGLPKASEACFSVAAHFSMVDARLSRLASMQVDSDVDRAAIVFLRRLTAFWCDIKVRLQEGCTVLDLGLDVELPEGERCLSPSDFGFHNALVRPDGSLCFIDFEYAGWDDPAKTVGDFFSHPGVAVPRTQFEPFLVQAFAPYADAQKMMARTRLLEPISQVKWCCIILNEFLPTAARRRNFANPGADTIANKQRQLEKATQLFESLQR